MSNSEIDLRKLAAMIEKKREGRPYRVVVEEIGGVSSPTLSRIEKGRLPDLDTFIRICRWLNVSPEELQNSPTKVEDAREISTRDTVCAFLRADKNLPLETAKALTMMIDLAYRDAVEGRIKD